MKNKLHSAGIGKLKRIDIIFIVVMLSVPVVHFAIFWFGVNINSLLMAFQLNGEWSLFNFEQVFDRFSLEGSDLLIAIRNTLIYFAKDVLILPFHLLIAYFLYKKIKGYRFFQVVFYLPAVISGVVVATVFQNFIASGGPLEAILNSFGVKEVPPLLTSSKYATVTILFYTIWLGWGGHMLLLGGALARIPVEIIESARIDGIASGREIVYIIAPLVWPTMSTLLILSMTTMFATSGPILLFTQGQLQTWTIGYWIFHQLKYVQGMENIVSATGLVFTAVGVPLILFVKWLVERVPVVEY